MNTISRSDLIRYFKILSNNPNGNCLFHAFIQLCDLKKSIYTLRHELGVYYAQFDKTKTYDEHTTCYNIWLGLLYDNVDEDGCNHDTNIANNYVWASMTDVLAMSIIHKVNVLLFTVNPDKSYSVNPIINDSSYTVVSLLFKNGNHFEALVPQSPFPFPMVERKNVVDDKDPFIVVQRHKRIKAKQ